jgi:hypothetical protein
MFYDEGIWENSTSRKVSLLFPTLLGIRCRKDSFDLPLKQAISPSWERCLALPGVKDHPYLQRHRDTGTQGGVSWNKP